MKTNYQKVLDFNTCFNHKVSNEEFKDVFQNDPKLVTLRLSLIEEEIKELQEAYENDDIVEIIDALSDILYVAYGLCVCFGINIDTKYHEYTELYLQEDSRIVNMDEMENMSNFYKTQIIIKMFSDIKDYSTNISKYMFKENLNTINKSIINSFDNLRNSCDSENFDDVVINIYNVIKYTYLFGIQIGCDLDKSFTIVHDSNMTKICDNEDLAIETVQNYKDNDSRYDSPIYKKNEFGYIILNESTGKILKSIKYTPANFDSILN
jgi:predicted HAD superfamily Cof-like phosphohydrolase